MMTPTDDPWTAVIRPQSGIDWHDRSSKEKGVVVLHSVLKPLALLGLLYFFVCSLDVLSNAFRLLGGKVAGEVFRTNAILSNPVADLMIGVLATVTLQSSSTSTSIVVTMVAAEIIPVRPAIFLVMGANIGTSITSTLVALGHLSSRAEFRRAFAGATVHDMFNWLTVICLLPIEWLSGSIDAMEECGMLCQITGVIVRDLKPTSTSQYNSDILKVITKPLTSLVIQLDKDVLHEYVILNVTELATFDKSLVKHKCSGERMVPVGNGTDFEAVLVKERCVFLFEYLATKWSDQAVGFCLLVFAVVVLCSCLFLIVTVLHSLLKGKIVGMLKTFINADLPGNCKCCTGYFAILLGAGLTMLVQSSSVFTSAITPLVGVGALHIDRMYPLTLGANIGTTGTAILAALAADAAQLYASLQVALCHLLFNLFGILIWYPIPFMRNIPITLAKNLGNITAMYRWFAVVYLLAMFILLPLTVFALSIAGSLVLVGVGLALTAVMAAVAIINTLQDSHPHLLPTVLRDWNFLPEAMRSLKPYDDVMIQASSYCLGCPCVHETTIADLYPDGPATRGITEHMCGGPATSMCAVDQTLLPHV